MSDPQSAPPTSVPDASAAPAPGASAASAPRAAAPSAGAAPSSAPDGAKAPTVYDVAGHAGVSIATVSRVLRTPDAVREATRDRVHAAIRELGYVPSGNARALAGNRTGVLGLFFPGNDAIDAEVRPGIVTDGGVRVVDDRNPSRAVASGNLYFDEVLRGAEVEAWRQGFALMVAAGRGSSRDVIVNDVAGRVDGLAVLASTVPDDLLAHVARRLPVVVVAGSWDHDTFDHVGVDNTEGMRVLANHVLGRLGITDVAYVAGSTDSPDDAERLEGFRAALADCGVDESGVRVVHGDFSRGRARELADALLDEHVPRAIISSNDQAALGALDAVQARGLRVPEDVVLTGFDGIDAARFSTPPLTTVHQPMADLGRAAVRAVVDRIASPNAPARSVRLPVEVLLRASCPPEL